MKDYVVQSGPLRTFDGLYDERYEKLRHVADYHTIEITGRAGTMRVYRAEINRSDAQEILFVSSFFSAIAQGHRTMFGIRDVTAGKASALALKLKSQTRLKWCEMKYSNTEDVLVLVELQDFAGDFRFIMPFVPPDAGDMFFYLTGAPFDLLEIYWSRAAGASLKSQQDRFRPDVIGFAGHSHVALVMDQRGSYTVVIHPDQKDLQAVESKITAAGRGAAMSISFAPSLFG